MSDLDDLEEIVDQSRFHRSRGTSAQLKARKRYAVKAHSHAAARIKTKQIHATRKVAVTLPKLNIADEIS